MLSTCCRSNSVCRMVHPPSVAHENGTLCVQGCTETVKGKMFQDFNL